MCLNERLIQKYQKEKKRKEKRSVQAGQQCGLCQIVTETLHSTAWTTGQLLPQLKQNTQKNSNIRQNLCFSSQMLFIDVFAIKYLDLKGLFFYLNLFPHDSRRLIDDNGNKVFCHNTHCLPVLINTLFICTEWRMQLDLLEFISIGVLILIV